MLCQAARWLATLRPQPDSWVGRGALLIQAFGQGRL